MEPGDLPDHLLANADTVGGSEAERCLSLTLAACDWNIPRLPAGWGSIARRCTGRSSATASSHTAIEARRPCSRIPPGLPARGGYTLPPVLDA